MAIHRGWQAALLVSTVSLLSACATSPAAPVPRGIDAGAFGVLVMAHGGSPDWNAGVLAGLRPLEAAQPVEVAFGMADAASLQDAVARLEARGARRIAVVRLFVSGESWYERTEQILGLAPGAPAKPAPAAGHAAHGGAHGGHSMEFWRLDTRASFALSTEGLVEAPEMGTVLADRARGLSNDPGREDVLILAHGPGDDAENARWLAHLEARAAAVRAALPFRRVQVATLREDWPDKRVAAEAAIRAYVERARAEGGRALVIPFRVHGFGPYKKVLDGLDYASDGQGLIPHDGITRWLKRQVAALRTATYRAPNG